MLEQVNFPLTRVQIFDFILAKGYTTFFTLQQAIADLIDAELILAKSTRNSTQLHITEKGQETLSYFGNRISDDIKSEIKEYFSINGMDMRNEVSTKADYYKDTNGGFTASLSIKDKQEILIELSISVPTEEAAVGICNNWQKKNQDIYAYVMKQLI
jgi:hypothetical protein